MGQLISISLQPNDASQPPRQHAACWCALYTAPCVGSCAQYNVHCKCRRLQQANTTIGTVGTACVVGPTCSSLNVSCKIDPVTAITDAGTSLTGLQILATGCLLAPRAASNVSSSPITNLNMNALFQMLVVTEDTLFPVPNR